MFECNFHMVGLSTCQVSNSIFFMSFNFQRAAFLEKDREMENAHSVAASSGDTEVYFAI